MRGGLIWGGRHAFYVLPPGACVDNPEVGEILEHSIVSVNGTWAKDFVQYFGRTTGWVWCHVIKDPTHLLYVVAHRQ